MTRRRLRYLVVGLLWIPQLLLAQEIGPKNGSLLIAGGGHLGTTILERFNELAGGAEARIVLIPTAGSADSYNDNWSGKSRFESYPHQQLTVLHTRDPNRANEGSFVAPLKNATAVWFSGGRQWRLADSYLGTLVHHELHRLLERGGVIGGSSAGASIQGSYLIRGDTKTNRIMMGDHEEGLGFLKHVGVDQHLLRLNRQFDILPVLRKHRNLLGIGVDEGTAIVVQGDEFEVIGDSYVAVYEQKTIHNPSQPFRLLSKGQRYTMKRQNEPLQEILFGSCIKETQPIPILETIRKHHPAQDLFLFLGDNIYADTKDPEVMKTKYGTLAANQSFHKLFTSIPLLATWDDHDYGLNDAGGNYEKKLAAEQIFLDFWKIPQDSPQRRHPGIYHTERFGPPGKRVQILMLDTRYFRSSLDKGERRVGGPYVPSQDASKTLLGEEQWTWLANQLKQDATVRIIVSSIQLVPDDAGQECWANLPHERDRFFQLLHDVNANGVIVVSGDRHWAELSVESHASPYPIYDLTSSSLNQPHARGTPTLNTTRLSAKTYHRANYGRIAIDWDAPSPRLRLEIRDVDGQVRIGHDLRLDQLQK